MKAILLMWQVNKSGFVNYNVAQDSLILNLRMSESFFVKRE